MRLSPDAIIFWQSGFFKINATLVFTWVIMAVLTAGSVLVTSRLSTGLTRSRWQNVLEMIVTAIKEQIREVGLADPGIYLPFLGTIFLFVAASALFTILPGFEPPTGSLSTTAALALLVFTAVHAVFWTNIRMRSPLMPVVAIAAAAGLAIVVRNNRLRKA